MDDAKQQLVDKLQNSTNILVSVSRNPSVDQLASCIGLTLLLNRMGKHAAAVFSGKVPSTLEFLQPQETIEKNTDSLRDFIISLDKAKADKLRYKVEEDVVRIFITPYKTSLSQADLEFSEGDFNVDVVVALGVKQQEDLDQAITAHGRILHDATVTSINAANEGGLGSINWNDPQTSSLSEMVTDLAQIIGSDMLDSQIATSLMTGIVAETDRFSNDKTSSQTMSASALLMNAGANQQLVATKLEAGGRGATGQAVPATDGEPQESSDGLLEIDHTGRDQADAPAEPSAASLPPEPEPPVPPAIPVPPPAPQPGPSAPPEPPVKPERPAGGLSKGSKLMTEPPSLGGTLTANTSEEGLDPTTDPLSLPQAEPPQLFGQQESPAETPAAAAPPPVPAPAPTPPPPPTPPAPVLEMPKPTPLGSDAPPEGNATLTDIEKAVHSPHIDQNSLDTMRDEVSKALGASEPAAPIEALNAQPLGGDLHATQPPAAPPAPAAPAAPAPAPAADDKKDGGAPPPVPPPIPFQFGNSPPPQ